MTGTINHREMMARIIRIDARLIRMRIGSTASADEHTLDSPRRKSAASRHERSQSLRGPGLLHHAADRRTAACLSWHAAGCRNVRRNAWLGKDVHPNRGLDTTGRRVSLCLWAAHTTDGLHR